VRFVSARDWVAALALRGVRLPGFQNGATYYGSGQRTSDDEAEIGVLQPTDQGRIVRSQGLVDFAFIEAFDEEMRALREPKVRLIVANVVACIVLEIIAINIFVLDDDCLGLEMRQIFVEVAGLLDVRNLLRIEPLVR
jgi:hypothetical protein